MTGGTTRDAFLGGRLMLVQPARGHRVGTDAALLAACVAPKAGDVVLDMGSGVGAAGLAIAIRAADCRVVLVDDDHEIAGMARRNIEDNGLAGVVTMVEADLTAKAALRPGSLAPGLADIAIMNPPFHLEGTVSAPADAYRKRAHLVHPDDDRAWIEAACGFLRPKGILAIVHRADALPRLLSALSGRFGDIRIKPVQARPGEAAGRILVRARRGSRAPLAILPPLVMHDAEGAFTSEADALHRGDGVVDWQDQGRLPLR